MVVSGGIRKYLNHLISECYALLFWLPLPRAKPFIEHFDLLCEIILIIIMVDRYKPVDYFFLISFFKFSEPFLFHATTSTGRVCRRLVSNGQL